MCTPMLPWSTRVHTLNGISIGSAVFLHSSRQKVPYTLQWDARFPLKISSSHGECGLHLIHGSLGPPSPHTKRQLGQFSSFCRAHDRDRQTERQTDYTTPSVTIGHIYVYVYVVLRCGLQTDVYCSGSAQCRTGKNKYQPCCVLPVASS